jgi:hypothetical protein
MIRYTDIPYAPGMYGMVGYDDDGDYYDDEGDEGEVGEEEYTLDS